MNPQRIRAELILDYVDAVQDKYSPLRDDPRIAPFVQWAITRYGQLRGSVNFTTANRDARAEGLVMLLDSLEEEV